MFHIADVPIPALPTHPAVQRAADWLDTAAPGWAEKINPRTLNISCATHCVLGQVFSDHPKAQQWDAQATPAFLRGGGGYQYGRKLAYEQHQYFTGEVFASDDYRADWLREIRVRQLGTPMGEADAKARERDAQCPYNLEYV